jgi:hypothetical protein
MDTSSSADFRSRRFKLPKEAFAIAPEIEPEPTDVNTREDLAFHRRRTG